MGRLAATREATAKTHAAIERLCREGIPPSLIVTLHRVNATRDRLPRMHDWLRSVQALGVTSARLHVLEVESDEIRAEVRADSRGEPGGLLSFARLEKELTTLRFDVFQDMRRLLEGRDNHTTCVWNACDPYTTRAVRGVEGTGQRSNCGRTNKDGIDFTKAASEGFERYLALYHTPQEHGGCRDCRFFLMCKGQCPGTAIDGDWRNRTEQCEVWMRLYEHLEAELLQAGETPLSLDPLRPQVEAKLLEGWARGVNVDGRERCDGRRVDAQSAPPRSGDGHGDIPIGERATAMPERARASGTSRLHAARLHAPDLGERRGARRLGAAPQPDHEGLARDRVAHRRRRRPSVWRDGRVARGVPGRWPRRGWRTG